MTSDKESEAMRPFFKFNSFNVKNLRIFPYFCIFNVREEAVAILRI